MTPKQLRNHFSQFDSLWSRVSSKALLKDTEYADDRPFEADFHRARQMLADLFGLPIERLHETYSENQFDCDDFAGTVCSLIKIIDSKRSKSEQAYPVFSCALKENHTVLICYFNGIKFGDPQNGSIWTPEEYKTNVIFIG